MKKSKKILYAILITVLFSPFLIKLTLTFISQSTELTSAIYAITILFFAVIIFAITYIYFEFVDYRKNKKLNSI